MPMRKIWLGAACLAAAGGLLRSEYEKRHFVTEEFQILSEKIRRERTFVFLSDLHNQEFGPGNRKLLKAVEAAGPDFVLIGGDMMVTKDTCETGPALHLTRELAARYPVYYGNGNHETRMRDKPEVYGDHYGRYMEAVRKAGVVCLSDSTAVDGDLAITGIDLPKKYYKKFRPARLTDQAVEKLAGPADRERFQILLAHSPLFFDAYSRWGADLTLAGHFHGGTIRLPILGGVMTPQYQFFLPCCGGEFERDGRKMIVSRGLGTHSIPIWFNNKPQLVVVHLKKKPTF